MIFDSNGQQLMVQKSCQPVQVRSLSRYLQGFIHPRWCRISSINRMKESLVKFALVVKTVIYLVVFLGISRNFLYVVLYKSPCDMLRDRQMLSQGSQNRRSKKWLWQKEFRYMNVYDIFQLSWAISVVSDASKMDGWMDGFSMFISRILWWIDPNVGPAEEILGSGDLARPATN